MFHFTCDGTSVLVVVVNARKWSFACSRTTHRGDALDVIAPSSSDWTVVLNKWFLPILCGCVFFNEKIIFSHKNFASMNFMLWMKLTESKKKKQAAFRRTFKQIVENWTHCIVKCLWPQTDITSCQFISLNFQPKPHFHAKRCLQRWNAVDTSLWNHPSYRNL